MSETAASCSPVYCPYRRLPALGKNGPRSAFWLRCIWCHRAGPLERVRPVFSAGSAGIIVLEVPLILGEGLVPTGGRAFQQLTEEPVVLDGDCRRDQEKAGRDADQAD